MSDGSMGDSATLSLSGLGPIYSARAQATSASNYGVAFDDITFTPVPEPGTLALLCLGGTGLLAGFRRRK